MSMLGTDVLSLACIFGGATAAAALTYAATNHDQPTATTEPCFAEVAHAGPTVVLSIGKDGEHKTDRIVIAPGVSVGAGSTCVVDGHSVDIQVRAMTGEGARQIERAMPERAERLEAARQRVDAARARAEAARVRAEAAGGLERIRESGGR